MPFRGIFQQGTCAVSNLRKFTRFRGASPRIGKCSQKSIRIPVAGGPQGSSSHSIKTGGESTSKKATKEEREDTTGVESEVSRDKSGVGSEEKLPIQPWDQLEVIKDLLAIRQGQDVLDSSRYSPMESLASWGRSYRQ